MHGDLNRAFGKRKPHALKWFVQNGISLLSFQPSPSILAIFKGRHKSLCLKVGRRMKNKIYNKMCGINYYKSDKSRKCCSRSSKQDMKRYEYSRNTVHVTYMHIYFHNLLSLFVRLRSAVGSASGCKSRGCEFGPQSGHITFKEIDQNDSWNNLYGHSPHSADSSRAIIVRLLIPANMCTQYWITA